MPTYAGDRICWDADSHLMPLPDFLSRHADPALRDELRIDGGPNGGAKFQNWFGKIISEVAFEDVGWLIEQAGDDLFLFSTDYPHPEGGRNPIKRFEDSMDAVGIAPATRERFYAGNFEDLLGL